MDAIDDANTTEIVPDNKNIIVDGKQTLVTNTLEINARTLEQWNGFFCKKLSEWTKNRSNNKILMICGAHGKPDGSLDNIAEVTDLTHHSNIDF